MVAPSGCVHQSCRFSRKDANGKFGEIQFIYSAKIPIILNQLSQISSAGVKREMGIMRDYLDFLVFSRTQYVIDI